MYETTDYLGTFLCKTEDWNDSKEYKFCFLIFIIFENMYSTYYEIN